MAINFTQIRTAIKTFLVNSTGLPAERIIKANQGIKLALPFVEFNEMSGGYLKRGLFDSQSIDPDDGSVTTYQKRSMIIQIDFYGSGAMAYAQAVFDAIDQETHWQLFEDINCSISNEEDVKDLTGLEDNNFLERAQLEISLQVGNSVTDSSAGYFDTVHIESNELLPEFEQEISEIIEVEISAITGLESIFSPSVLPPENLEIESYGLTDITVSFSPAENADSYIIEYSPDGSETWSRIYLTDTTYKITGLISDSIYDFRVISVRDGVESVASEEIPGITDNLLPPANLAVTAYNLTSISIEYDPAEYATGYIIAYSSDNFVTTQTIENSDTDYTITGLDPNQSYKIKVKSVSGEIESSYSSPITQSTATISAPANLAVSNVTDTTADFDWDTATYATSYIIEISADDFANKLIEQTVLTNSYSAIGLPDNTPLKARVTGKAGSFEGTTSSPVSFTTETSGVLHYIISEVVGGYFVPRKLNPADVTPATSSLFTPVANNHYMYISYNAEKNRLAYMRQTSGGQKYVCTSLIDGTDEQILAGSPAVNPAWSIDGNYIFFFNESTKKIMRLTIASDGTGSNLTEITSTAASTEYYYIYTSRNNDKKISFYDFQGGSGYWIKTANQESPFNVTTILSDGYYTDAPWKPDGSRLAVAGRKAVEPYGTMTLYNPDGTNRTNVAGTGSDSDFAYTQCSWIDDSNILALRNSGVNEIVESININTQVRTVLINNSTSKLMGSYPFIYLS